MSSSRSRRSSDTKFPFCFSRVEKSSSLTQPSGTKETKRSRTISGCEKISLYGWSCFPTNPFYSVRQSPANCVLEIVHETGLLRCHAPRNDKPQQPSTSSCPVTGESQGALKASRNRSAFFGAGFALPKSFGRPCSVPLGGNATPVRSTGSCHRPTKNWSGYAVVSTFRSDDECSNPS